MHTAFGMHRWPLAVPNPVKGFASYLVCPPDPLTPGALHPLQYSHVPTYLLRSIHRP